MFYGLSNLFAELVAIVGATLILTVEGALLYRSRRQLRLERALLFAIPQPLPEVVPQSAPEPETPVFVDKTPTERIRVSEWLRGEPEQAPPAPPAPAHEPEPVDAEVEPAEEVLVESRAPKDRAAKDRGAKRARVRPSKRQRRPSR